MLLSQAFLLVIAGAGVAAAPGEAQAQQEEELSEARGKFQRALELKQARDFRGALKLLREVGQVKLTPQVRYHIATCEEQMGQLVAAMGGYEFALSQSRDMPPDFTAEVEAAIAELRARIPKLILKRGRGAESAVLELDQVKLGEGSLGGEIPVDPGPHFLVGEARGFLPYRETVTVAERQVQSVLIELDPLPPPPPARPPPPAPRYGPWPYVIGGTGIVGIAAGAILLPLSQDKAAQALTICGGSADCTGIADLTKREAAESLAGEALRLETAGWIAGGAGVATLATGVVLWWLDSKPREPSVGGGRQPAAGWSISGGAPGSSCGMSVRGSF